MSVSVGRTVRNTNTIPNFVGVPPRRCTTAWLIVIRLCIQCRADVVGLRWSILFGQCGRVSFCTIVNNLQSSFCVCWGIFHIYFVMLYTGVEMQLRCRCIAIFLYFYVTRGPEMTISQNCRFKNIVVMKVSVLLEILSILYFLNTYLHYSQDFIAKWQLFVHLIVRTSIEIHRGLRIFNKGMFSHSFLRQI